MDILHGMRLAGVNVKTPSSRSMSRIMLISYWFVVRRKTFPPPRHKCRYSGVAFAFEVIDTKLHSTASNNNRINSLRQICTIRRAISLPNKGYTEKINTLHLKDKRSPHCTSINIV